MAQVLGQIKPIRFENDASEELNALAEKRWTAFKLACEKNNLLFPATDDVIALLKKYLFSAVFLPGKVSGIRKYCWI